MSRSVHTSRAKFRKAFQFEYSNNEERTRVLGKIIDECMLRRAMKANAQLSKKAKKNGVKPSRVYSESCAAASKKSPPSPVAKELVKQHNRKGYG